MSVDSLLSVRDLRVSFQTREAIFEAVSGVSFDVFAGKTLGIVGESGSGKSVTGHALTGLLAQPPARIDAGSAIFNGVDLIDATESALRKVRGNEISMVFQNPMAALNPYQRTGKQIIEPLLHHHNIGKHEAKERAMELLDAVGIDQPAQRYKQYPHELSGGMCQRVLIAMALITEPKLLIADEPTSALDVTVQRQIIDLLQEIQRSQDIGIIFVSHDLDVVGHIADELLVMQNGEIVEQGSPEQVLTAPTQLYTQRLVASIPNSSKPDAYRYQGASSNNLLEVESVTVHFPLQGHTLTAVNDVSLSIRHGEVLGMVGESGSGKSTLAEVIVQLNRPDHGVIRFDGATLSSNQHANGDIQMIFQDPYSSLDPRMTATDIIAEPLLVGPKAGTKSPRELTGEVADLMQEVGLESQMMNKYPHEFSGGQCQRIAIARAVAAEPTLVVADEPVSALDVTVQAQVLSLLLQLVRHKNLTMLFISHDLAVVRYISDRVIVMKNGRVVEQGETEQIYSSPQQTYTKDLIAARRW